MYETFQVVTAGAGLSGMAAALAAARLGCRTLLAEAEPFPGGREAALLLPGEGMPHPAEWQASLLKQLAENGVAFLNRTQVYGVSWDGQQLAAYWRAARKGHSLRLTGQVFVDATGSPDLWQRSCRQVTVPPLCREWSFRMRGVECPDDAALENARQKLVSVLRREFDIQNVVLFPEDGGLRVRLDTFTGDALTPLTASASETAGLMALPRCMQLLRETMAEAVSGVLWQVGLPGEVRRCAGEEPGLYVLPEHPNVLLCGSVHQPGMEPRDRVRAGLQAGCAAVLALNNGRQFRTDMLSRLPGLLNRVEDLEKCLLPRSQASAAPGRRELPDLATAVEGLL